MDFVGHSLDPARALRAMLLLALALAAPGCATRSAPAPLPGQQVDVLLVPGCPSLDGGVVSPCQWRRAIWAARLFRQGLAARVIASGSAVHNRWYESEGIAAALVSLGVPASRIATETQALHTDENAAYALWIAEAMGCRSVMVAAEGPFQTRGMCEMARRWGWSCVEAPPDEAWIREELSRGVPELRTDPEPKESWVHWRRREVARSRAEGREVRGASMARYLSMAARGSSGREVPQPRPPVPEPTLAADLRCR